jgi:ABC-type bacteriocin/lantibiotic exporter with double-glycine peptidase domain
MGYKLSKRGQLTILDMILVPIAAVLLSIFSILLLQNATANLINSVNQEPAAQTCSFALETLYGHYYVDTPAALNELSLFYPNQYQMALSNQQSLLSANCGSSCSLGYSFLSNSLTNFTSLYSDFINYFSSFSVNNFQSIASSNAVTLNILHMRVYLNQVPPATNGSTVCSLQVYNPVDPSNPYTVFGVMT